MKSRRYIKLNLRYEKTVKSEELPQGMYRNQQNVFAFCEYL